MAPTDERIGEVIAGLLREREPSATICPSDAARALAPQDWRALMPRVRDVALGLARQGKLVLKQGGREIPDGEPLRGPIRLGRAG